jgi:hypothetical protein
MAALIVAQLAATDSFYLLHKYFWTDELCTYALITDPDLGHAFRAMQGAVDINPPGLHILLLGYMKLVNSTSEVALRSFALVSMVVTLVGIYAVVRELYGALPAAAATLIVWSHPLILDHAFEMRYYGPWLASAVWFCFLLGRARARTLGRVGTVALGVTAFFMCTVHYFGIVTLGLIVAGEWLWQRRQPMYARAHMAAIAVGPLATALAVVFLLPHQRAVTTVPTWVPDPNLADIADFGMTVFLPLHLGALILVGWLSRLTTREPASDAPAAATPVSSAAIGLTSLAAYAPALIAFSFLVQSVLVSRYGIPAILALAPAAAYAVARMTKGWAIVLIAFLISASAFELRQRSMHAREQDAERTDLIEAIRRHAGDGPVVFEAPHQLNVVWHYARDLRGRVFLLDFEKGQLGDNVSPFRIWSLDLARQIVMFYDAPPLLSWNDVQARQSVFIVPYGEAYKAEPDPRDRYSRFVMTPVQGQLHQLVRTDGR